MRNVLIEKSFSKDKINNRFLIENGCIENLTEAFHYSIKLEKPVVEHFFCLYNEDFCDDEITIFLRRTFKVKTFTFINSKQMIRNLLNRDFFDYVFENLAEDD